MFFITTVSPNGTRCVGYVSSLDEAIDIVKNNRYDLNEAGCYPWVVIEYIKEGIYQYDFNPLWFQYDETTDKYIERDFSPDFIEHATVGFAIG